MYNKYIIGHFLCQIPPDILTHFLVSSSPEGLPNTPKIRQISGGIWQRKCPIIYLLWIALVWCLGIKFHQDFMSSHSPPNARSKFWGVSGSADRDGNDNSIQFINIGGWVTKVLKNGDKNRGVEGWVTTIF